MDNLSESSSDLEEDLFREYDVLSSNDDPDEKFNQFEYFDDAVYKKYDADVLSVN